MRIVRRLVHALVLVLMLLVGATAAVVIVSQTSWFKNWLRGYIVREAAQYLNGTLSIDRLGGNLFFGVEMENVGVSMDGSEVVAVKDLGLDYNVFELISKGLSVNMIRLDSPVVYLRREGDTWSIARLLKKRDQDPQAASRPVAIDQIAINDGALILDTSTGPVGTSGTSTSSSVALPKRFDHLDARLAFNYSPASYTIQITQVSFRGSDPTLTLNALSGGISVRDDAISVQKLGLRTAESSLSVDGVVQQYSTAPVINLQVSSDKVSLPELSAVVPALSGIALQPAFEVKLNGPFDRLGVDMNLRSSAGQVTGNLIADIKSPQQSVAGTVSVRKLDLGPILKDARQKSDITADAKVDVRAASFSDINSMRGTVSLAAPRIVAAGYTIDQVKANARIDGRRIALDGDAAAYGATATTAGSVILPENANAPLAFDLHGQARHLDLRRLPRNLNAPPAETNVNGDYHVQGSVQSASRQIQGDVRFAPSTLAGATIEGGSTASVSMNGAQVAYQADTTISHLNLKRVGEDFRVPSLASDRYDSVINGHVAVNGRGTAPRDMDVTASGTLHDTAILGGRIPQIAFDAAMRQDVAHLKANGSFAGFDPAVASGKPAMKGMVGGTLDIDATLTNVSQGVTPESLEAMAKVNLDPSNIGGLEIAKATIDGDYRDSTADLRTFDITGRDMNAQATGTLVLNDTGQSNLKVHTDTPSLAEIGKLVDLPITGIAKADFTVTGNKHALQATGNVTGDAVKYGSNGALTLSSDFTAKVPDLDAANMNVSAMTHGTFVTVGGQNINDVTATTEYGGHQVSFDATAKQPERTVAAAGVVLLQPDYQELHLQRLSLTAQGLNWQAAGGSEAKIRYANGAVTVDNVKLVNGDQQIAADGTYGHAGDRLKVAFTNVDVGVVDTLMLRPPQLSGRLNATATVTSQTSSAGQSSGPTPLVNADFSVDMGGFRQFRYDSFGGTVNYSGTTVTLDTKLQQNPTTWLAAKGRVPMALFGGSGSLSEPIDLHVDSTPIDVALVQGFTSQLTKVTGTLEAHVNVTGTAADPLPDGTVTIQNAAFTLEPTGVVYTDLDGKIELRPDRVHIDQIRLLDNQRKPLTVTGDLAIRERQVGEMTISAKADDFKVIDNKLGNIRINSNLQLTGQLNAPRIEGSLGVTTGQVNLDPILDLVGDSAFPTQETQYTTTGTAAPADANANSQPQPAATAASGAGLMQALQVDVRLTVPDDLVIRANDLRTPGAPISLGALNLTLGGDIDIQQVPYDRIRLYGAINTVRGTYTFQGRQFTILRDGTVRFQGLDELNPALDIRTERVIQAVTANVNVRGTLKQPEIELTSTPPLEQADILSLIVFNQPINQLGEGQQISLAQRAQQLATGAVANQLAQSIGNALNLDTFEISTAPDSGAAAQLTIGEQVGQNLYVKVQQGIGDQSQTNFILEYELTKWLRLQTNVLQGSSTQQQLFQRMQGSGVNLLFFFSY